jgi:hypothetical protein
MGARSRDGGRDYDKERVSSQPLGSRSEVSRALGALRWRQLDVGHRRKAQTRSRPLRRDAHDEPRLENALTYGK